MTEVPRPVPLSDGHVFRSIWLGVGISFGMMVPLVAGATLLEGVTGAPLALGVLATLAAAVAVPIGILRAVSGHQRKVWSARATLREHLAGSGIGVEIESVRRRGSSGYVMCLTSLEGGLPPAIALAPQRLPLPDHATGDEAFDRAVKVGGDPVEALACLDAPARAALLSLLEVHPGWSLADGQLQATVPQGTPPGDVVAIGLGMAEALRSLRGSEDPEVRLAEIARSDPSPSVRIRATDALLLGRPDSAVVVALAEEVLAGDDVALALSAARALGLKDREAELLARREGARGQLGLAPNAGGELAVTEAREGAVSPEAVRGTTKAR